MSLAARSFPLQQVAAGGVGGGNVSRKPLPKQPGTATRPEIHTQSESQPYPPQQFQRFPQDYQSHSRTRTASSSVFPASEMAPLPSQPYQQPALKPNPLSYQTHPNQPDNPAGKRSLSNATTLIGGAAGGVPVRQNSGSSLARSTSSRSGNSPTSYVALMRKQKATVWSDRAQHEDPRLLAQQRAAKMRAAAEVSNASLNARTSTSGSSSSITGGVRSKILHHGAAKAQQYVQSGLAQSGVPVRLSQNEIDENEDESDNAHQPPQIHRRTDSGRSSLSSAGRLPSMYGMHHAGGQQAQSDGSTPPSGPGSRGSPVETRSPLSAEETPMPDVSRRVDYFARPAKEGDGGGSGGSGGSGGVGKGSPDESQFGDLGKLPLRAKNAEPEEKLSEAELKRRGSVDERTMTMSGYGKLFIANPDA